jgi:hypothetical protein
MKSGRTLGAVFKNGYSDPAPYRSFYRSFGESRRHEVAVGGLS